ncbi:MAG: hypothetical protein JSS20_14240 [Proteobacteria bacterium]|nr:hypothetical protein [Pseudomonadota bacterium]
MQDDIRAVVAQGISAGEKVVTVGFAQLSDGARVIVPGDVAPSGRTTGEAGGGDGQRKRHNGEPTGGPPADGQKKKWEGKKRDRAEGAAGKNTSE